MDERLENPNHEVLRRFINIPVHNPANNRFIGYLRTTVHELNDTAHGCRYKVDIHTSDDWWLSTASIYVTVGKNKVKAVCNTWQYRYTESGTDAKEVLTKIATPIFRTERPETYDWWIKQDEMDLSQEERWEMKREARMAKYEKEA